MRKQRSQEEMRSLLCQNKVSNHESRSKFDETGLAIGKAAPSMPKQG
ncbi:hypothetical protein [Ligilactobacillus pabuli]|nr:hypothetical protein [Ligilactobacillus pabuli]HIW89177.1 hypothetical protein [Candidatus Ligilactobacillus excrementipullorum]